MTDPILENEFKSEFMDSWDRYRIALKPFRLRRDFSIVRRVNVIEISGQNVTIEETNEGGDVVRSIISKQSLSNFRR